MTIKQQINHGDIQKVCHIFHSIHLCHTQLYSITSPVLLKISNYGPRKMILCIYDRFSTSHYIKGGKLLHEIALNKI